MKKYGFLFLILIIVLGGCLNTEPKSETSAKELSLEESITLLEEELFDSTSLRLDNRKALELIRLYEEYATTYPESELAPEYLFNAADISMNMRRPNATIALFDRIIAEYPDYKRSASALFLKAFVYEDQLKDYENARTNYELFLVKYPLSEFADDAEVSLKNLGKSPEELIKEFEEKQGE